MKKQGYTEAILRFVRSVILVDAILAGVVGLISFVLDWRTVETYGTALLWMGMIVMFFSCFIGIGGFSARSGDAGAYSLSGAGNMSENLMRIVESRQSSLGCFFLLLVVGPGLTAIGCLLPVIPVLFG